jgi:hypothetical protein
LQIYEKFFNLNKNKFAILIIFLYFYALFTINDLNEMKNMGNLSKEEQLKMLEPVNAKVVMSATTDDSPVNIRFKQFILGMVRFGKEIKISPKSHACLNKAGYEAKYFVETVSLCIGIGNDHTAELIMSKSAWEALKAGEKIHITTTEEFNKKYVYKIKE